MSLNAVTESQNPLTRNLDLADPVGIVRLLRQADAQLFAGWETYPCLVDEEVLEALARLSWKMSRCLAGEDSIVLLSGAGTSGRIAYSLCQDFNRQLREARLREVFVPLVAGGRVALVQAVESAEDDVAAAVRDLKEVLDSGDYTRGLFVGITSGLSAPYVASQLDFLGPNARFETAMLGFNPIEAARATRIEGWNHSVAEVLQMAQESPRFTLVNPICGPEAVTGSTRMKGGTLTRIILETAFATAFGIARMQLVSGGPTTILDAENLLPLREPIIDQLQRYRATIDATYGNVRGLAELVRLAASALRSGGRIMYLGRGNAGVAAIFDAAECIPTFGADPKDVRGFVYEGWEAFGLQPSLVKNAKSHEVGFDAFEEKILPDLQKGDLVIGACVQGLGDNTRRLLAEAARQKATTALLLVGSDQMKKPELPEGLRHRCTILLPSTGYAPGVFNEAELALKISLNIITTGAHALSGKIFHNQMIDLKISNSKLHDRAISLICQLVGVSEEEAREALHHAIFKEPRTGEGKETSISMAVQRAAGRRRVVPLAALLATKLYNYEQAEAKLAAEPRVRRIIEEIVGGGLNAP